MRRRATTDGFLPSPIDTLVLAEQISIFLYLRDVRSLSSFQLRNQCESTDQDSSTDVDYDGSLT